MRKEPITPVGVLGEVSENISRMFATSLVALIVFAVLYFFDGSGVFKLLMQFNGIILVTLAVVHFQVFQIMESVPRSGFYYLASAPEGEGNEQGADTK